MLRLSVNEMTTYRWSFEEDVQNYAALGISAISVWRPKLSDFGEEKGADLLQESRMEVASLLWAGGFTATDGHSTNESVQDALDAVRLAATLKAGSLIVYTGARGLLTHKHVRRLVTGALQRIADLAETLGVTLAIEPMHAGCSRDWTFLTEVDETLALLDAVGSPRMKMVFDTYHLGHSPAVVARLAELAPQIALVQLGDGKRPPAGEQNRCRLGDGVLPLRTIVSSLAAGGYDGFYDLELMGEEIEACDYVALLSHSKHSVEELFGMVDAGR